MVYSRHTGNVGKRSVFATNFSALKDLGRLPILSTSKKMFHIAAAVSCKGLRSVLTFRSKRLGFRGTRAFPLKRQTVILDA